MFVFAGTVAAAALLAVGGAANGSAPHATPVAAVAAVGTLHFRLELFADCTAVLVDAGSGRRGAPTPFAELYNRVEDGQDANLEPCVRLAASASAERREEEGRGNHQSRGGRAGESGGRERSADLVVTAAHGYGTVGVSVAAAASPGAGVVITVTSVAGWDVGTRIVAFGEFWAGHLDNQTASPIVMGKLQGPRSLSGFDGGGAPARLPSAGYATLSRRGYYKHLLGAEAGDSVGFLFGPTATIDAGWQALGAERDVAAPRPHRFASWYWSSEDISEANVATYVGRAKSLGAELLFMMGVVEPTNWDIDRAKFPSGVNKTAAFIRSQGLLVGLHTLPYAPTSCQGECARSAFVQESGLAPTYRSGNSPPTTRGVLPTEDLGFWWGHDGHGDEAGNGNPVPTWYGFECPQYVPGYHCGRWGSNMTLNGTYWSPLGDFRQGGSIGFDGTSSFATVQQRSKFGALIADGLRSAPGLTLGLVAHPDARGVEAGARAQTLAALNGSFALELLPGVGAAWRPKWTVQLQDGSRVTAEAASACVLAGVGNAIKATYNATSRQAILFVNNTRVAASPSSAVLAAPGPTDTLSASPRRRRAPEERTAPPPEPTRMAVLPTEEPIFFGAEGPRAASGFAGSLEEIYLKNATTENRVAYVYTDNVRPDPRERVYIFDLNRDSGRAYFAEMMSKVLNADGANFDTTQWDGFEVSLVMAGTDFPRSRRTARSGLYRGVPSPDWYHLGWPLLWGQGVLQGMEDVMARTNNNTAVECSFMAPGLGPWRPDFVPYVDERDDSGLIGLGLEWHPKMMFRTEISGVPVNPYHTPLSWVKNATELDYWLGGLVTAGVAPQLSEFGGPVTAWDATARRWLGAYRDFGHMVEGGLTTLFHDPDCCHVQGECEWDVCRDVVASMLVGGQGGAGPVSGVYVGADSDANAPTAVPLRFTPGTNATLLVFASWTTRRVVLAAGSPSATTALRVVATSPTPNCTLTLSGGMLSALAADESVDVTEINSDGTVARRWTLSGPGNVTAAIANGAWRELRLRRRRS